MAIIPNKALRTLIVDQYRTQELFAAAIGMNEGAVSKIVRGIKPPTPSQIEIICSALKVAQDVVFGEQPELPI